VGDFIPGWLDGKIRQNFTFQSRCPLKAVEENNFILNNQTYLEAFA
jgi:hypothetical protein